MTVGWRKQYECDGFLSLGSLLIFYVEIHSSNFKEDIEILNSPEKLKDQGMMQEKDYCLST